jgi:hypothetical protein
MTIAVRRLTVEEFDVLVFMPEYIERDYGFIA